MDWINTAVLSAAIMGAVNILDSHLLTRRFPGLREFLFVVAAIQIIYAIILCIVFPLPAGLETLPLLAVIASGLLRTASVLILLYNLKREEVSQVIPIVYTQPIFVAIIAALLLGEKLNPLGYIAIVIVVAGAVMISITRNPSGTSTIRFKLLLQLFCASLFFAIADIASKYALNFISFWNTFWLSAFCMTGIFFIITVRSDVMKKIAAIHHKTTVMGLTVFNETLAPVGLILSLWALKRGPVSLVSTIVGTRPMFVLLFAFIISRIAPAFLKLDSGRVIVALRIFATVMIVSGLAIIQLM
jgi:drug/metabolite transporter (DMT)-like permease